MTRNQYAKQYAKEQAAYERRLYPIFSRALKAQVAPVINYMERNPFATVPVDLLIQPDYFLNAYKRAYEEVGIIAAKREYSFQRREFTGKDGIFDFLVEGWRQYFVEYATNYAYQVQSDLTETTRRLIREALAEAYNSGLAGNPLINYLKKKAQVISRNRAKVISRTETTTIANVAKELGAREWLTAQGETGYKQWVGRNDKRERHTHRAVNDKIIPMDGLFDLGGEQCSRPGDLVLSAKERVQCRCVLMFMGERRALRLIARQG